MAMTMLCASMGVLATGEAPVGNNTTLVWAWDFENENIGLVGSETYPKVQTETSVLGGPSTTGGLLYKTDSRGDGTILSDNEVAGLTAFSGNRFLRLNTSSATAISYAPSTPHLIPLERNTFYKLSFRFATAQLTAAYVNIAFSDSAAENKVTAFQSGNNNGAFWDSYPIYNNTAGCGKSTKVVETVEEVETEKYTNVIWNYYEVYFLSEDAADRYLRFTITLGKSATAYQTFYDDMKLEKVNGSTAVSFSSAVGGTSNYTNMIGTRSLTVNGQKAGMVGETSVMAYPTSLLRVPLENMQEKVVVSVTHLPKTEKENITLVIGQYAEENGNAKLLNIWSTPLEYTATTKKGEDGETVTEYYYAAEAVKKNAITLNELTNTTDSYLQAFVLDGISGLRPVGGKTVLKAATPAVEETPAE